MQNIPTYRPLPDVEIIHVYYTDGEHEVHEKKCKEMYEKEQERVFLEEEKAYGVFVNTFTVSPVAVCAKAKEFDFWADKEGGFVANEFGLEENGYARLLTKNKEEAEQFRRECLDAVKKLEKHFSTSDNNRGAQTVKRLFEPLINAAKKDN